MIDTLSSGALRDIVKLFAGEQIGEGVARVVYSMAIDPTRVLKVEIGAGSFQNVTEWETWQALKQTAYAAYLAPCHAISPCGHALIQERVASLPHEKSAAMRKLRLPDFLTDFKRDNYGWIKNRVVCCDYGSNLLLNHGAFASKMRKPAWW